MNFFKKIKNFFVDDRHEEDEYDDYYEDDEIDTANERRVATQHSVEQQDQSSKFRFPLIDDEPQHMGAVYEEPVRQQKKSAVFYDVEQDSGVKLPSHLPQQSLVYDVEVSNIAELLAKRNKSHGNSSIVRYDQAPLRQRSKGPVTSAEKRFLTANPKREDVVQPVVNREVPAMKKGKRFVPTDVPSPVHGFKKPKPIEELLPDFEQKKQEQQSTRLVDEKVSDTQSEEKVQFAPESNHVNVGEQTIAKQAEPLQQLVNAMKEEDVQAPEQAEEVSELTSKELQSEASKEQEKVEDIVQVESLQQASMEQDATLNGEQRLQDLSVQHLTIENSTVHIEQLLVEQPAPVVQPTINIEASSAPIVEDPVEQSAEEPKESVEAPISEQQQSVEEPKAEEPKQKSPSTGSRLPFNVIMLDSDKKKLQKTLSAYGVEENAPLSITDWKGNVITPAIDTNVKDVQQEEVPLQATNQQLAQNEQGGAFFLMDELFGESMPISEEREIADAAAVQQTAVSVATLEREEELTEVAATKVEIPSEVCVEENTRLEDIVAPEVQDEPALEQEQVAEAVDQEEPVVITALPEEVEENIIKTVRDERVPEISAASFSIVDEAPVTLETQQTNATISVNEPSEPEAPAAPIERASLYEAYEKPPMDFLMPAEERTEDWAWLDEQAEYLIAALASHQVQAQIESIEQGPAVTQFEITVAQGTKVSKVRNLSDDIKLALAAKDIRIDAPIPGKRTIGIEIPNRVSRAVRLSEVTHSERFIESESPLEAALGLDLSGKPVTLDLRKMPHGLIAGATGSGKSVCINSILVSLLYKADPNELKLMLIDPKMVELAPFNKIPHLVSPVITDVKAATAALKWAVEEMERRYQLFMHAGVRDLTRYNQQAEKARQFAQKLPYILIVIDELADLMMMAPADVEEAICRIAQKARACGIHLIVATQRPSVDVITGLIKSNIPTRIAFAVSSAIDSRTILDMQGAERLLGRGDMLYLGNGMQAPVRLQGTFVTDDEIEDIIAYVRSQGEPNYLFAQEDLIKRTEMLEEQDELFEEVCRYVYEQGTASTSSVQRNFHIGYNRAARLVDMLEKKGFVSEARGSKPRDVFINESDLDEMFR